jgi:hypothetical protein
MASFNEVDGSAYCNVSTTVGAEVRNISRNGRSVYFEYRAYIYQSTSTYTYNSLVLWVEGNKNVCFNSGSGSSHSSKGTKYYSNWYGKTVDIDTWASSVSVGIGVNGNYWNPSSAAGTVYPTLSGLPTCSAPSLSGISTSNLSDTSVYASFSVTNTNNGSILDYYMDIFTDSACTNKVGTISSNSGTFTGLNPNRTYYIRGNSSNAAGRSYTAVKSITTTFTDPSAPSNLRIECSNPEPIIAADYTFKWNAAGAGSTAVAGYRLRIYKNDVELECIDTESTSTEYTINAAAKGFAVGDRLKFGLYSYSKDWAGNKHFNGGGSGSAQVVSSAVTMVSDKFVYLSENGGTFTKYKVYISVNGGSFTEVKKEKLKIIS